MNYFNWTTKLELLSLTTSLELEHLILNYFTCTIWFDLPELFSVDYFNWIFILELLHLIYFTLYTSLELPNKLLQLNEFTWTTSLTLVHLNYFIYTSSLETLSSHLNYFSLAILLKILELLFSHNFPLTTSLYLPPLMFSPFHF